MFLIIFLIFLKVFGQSVIAEKLDSAESDVVGEESLPLCPDIVAVNRWLQWEAVRWRRRCSSPMKEDVHMLQMSW